MVSAFVHDPPFMRQSRTQKGSVDYLGMLLLISSLGVLQIVLDRGQRADWFNSPWVVYACALSGLASVRLVLHELHFSPPILDLRMLKLRIFDAALAVTVTFSAVLFGTLLLSPVFLQEFLGYSAWKAGLVQAPRGIGAMTSMMLVGNLARFGIDTRKFIGLGFILVAIGCWYSSRFNLQIGLANHGYGLRVRYDLSAL
jgi:DHA2 family multidrug resistance protein